MTFLISFFILACNTVVFSQHYRTLQPNSDNWEIGINMGLIGFSNEDTSSKLKNSQLGYGVSLSKQVSSLFGFKGHLLVGRLKGESPDFTFNFKLIETVINASVNISNLCLGTNRNQLINVYGLVGIGYSNFDGRSVNIATGVINDYGKHSGRGIFGYRLAGVGNLGLCVDFKLGNNFKATVESAFKFMNDNMLDGSTVVKSDYDSYN